VNRDLDLAKATAHPQELGALEGEFAAAGGVGAAGGAAHE
jgi:hypothetical protein